MDLKRLIRLLAFLALPASPLASTAAEPPFRAGCQAYTFNQFTANEAVERPVKPVER